MDRPTIPDTCESSAGARWAASAMIALGTTSAYLGSLHGPFVYDDNIWITWNRSIRRLWPLWDVLSPDKASAVYGRPVLSLSLALNEAIGGMNPLGYHAANLVIHVLAALTLFGIVRRTLGYLPSRFPREGDRTIAACAAALLWAVHPLLTESVTYVIQRAESLMGLFYLLTLYAFIRMVQAPNGRAWGFGAVLACLLGMGTKQVMVTAPFIVLVYDRTFIAGTFAAAMRARWGLYLGLAATWVPFALLGGGIGAAGVGFGLGYQWWAYALTECWVVAHYLMLAFWPFPLVFDYGADVVSSVHETIPWAAILVVLAAAGFIAFLRRLAAGFAAVWFFAILSPSSSFIPVAYEPMAESRMYLPLAAVTALVTCALWSALGRRSIPLLAAAALALGASAFLRNADYRTDVSIWTDTVLRRPNNERARLALGSALAMQGRNDEAARQFEAALRIDPGDFQARLNLGMALYHKGRAADALAQYAAIAPPTPDSPTLHYDIALALDLAGRMDAAVAEYAAALRLDPVYAEARNNLGSDLYRTGRVAEAVLQFGTALAAAPDSPRIHFNMALALASMDRNERAIAHYRDAVRLDPEYAEARNNLGNLLEQTGDTAGALAQYREALRARPGYATARSNLDRLEKATAPGRP
jgi:tetratricopeptide (TPR) repeat protein